MRVRAYGAGLLLSGIDQIIENCHVESMVRIFFFSLSLSLSCERCSRLDLRVTVTTRTHARIQRCRQHRHHRKTSSDTTRYREGRQPPNERGDARTSSRTRSITCLAFTNKGRWAARRHVERCVLTVVATLIRMRGASAVVAIVRRLDAVQRVFLFG